MQAMFAYKRKKKKKKAEGPMKMQNTHLLFHVYFPTAQKFLTKTVDF